MVVCFARDSVSVNGAACKLLCGSTFCNAINMLCICHTLNNTGSQLDLPVLAAFMTPWLDLVGGRHPHAGARELWRETVAPQRVPGFSNTRWFSKAEIQFVLAENFNKLPTFLRRLDEYGYGDATRQKLHTILEAPETASKLKFQLAAMLDIRHLVRTTYELEGDRLEIMLVFNRVEELRAFGRSLICDQGATVLPNLDAALRSSIKLEVGAKVSKFFDGFGFCEGKVVACGTFDSTLYPGQERRGYTIKYNSDGSQEDLEEEEVRPLLIVKDIPNRVEVVAGLIPAFEYLERRLMDDCDEPYKCSLACMR